MMMDDRADLKGLLLLLLDDDCCWLLSLNSLLSNPCRADPKEREEVDDDYDVGAKPP